MLRESDTSTTHEYLQSRTKRLGQRASSPLPQLTMLIIGWFFFSFCWKKRDIFQHWLGGMGDTWSGSSVPTTFGRDGSQWRNPANVIIDGNAYFRRIFRLFISQLVEWQLGVCEYFAFFPYQIETLRSFPSIALCIPTAHNFTRD